MPIAIKPYSLDDIESLYSLVIESTDHLKPWMPWCHTNYSITDTRNWVNFCIDAWSDQTAFRYLIIDNATKDILGAVGIERINPMHKIGELGYWVASNAVNRGVASAAAKIAARTAFEVHELNRIEINVLTNNIASNKVAQKLGATFEGTFRNKLFHNGESHAANCYSLIPSDIRI